ncbi:MAG: MBL fold metallo-hydrolase [Simkaniaceae bacterium]
MGVPVIGCECDVCRSDTGFNKRLRPSGLIQVKEKNFVIDTGPDFRYQALKHCIDQLHGILLTHTHNDHVAGVDDLRIYFLREKKKIPCLLSEDTLQDLRVRYHYLLHPKKESIKVSSQFHFHALKEDYGQISFEGMKVGYVSFYQAGMKVTGFCFKDFAYLTDIHTYSEEIFTYLGGIRTLVISAPRWKSSPVHFSLEEAIAFAEKIGAKQTYFTHIAHELDHETTNEKLPKGFQLGYDGLEFDVEIEEV